MIVNDWIDVFPVTFILTPGCRRGGSASEGDSQEERTTQSEVSSTDQGRTRYMYLLCSSNFSLLSTTSEFQHSYVGRWVAAFVVFAALRTDCYLHIWVTSTLICAAGAAFCFVFFCFIFLNFIYVEWDFFFKIIIIIIVREELTETFIFCVLVFPVFNGASFNRLQWFYPQWV